MLTVAAPFRMDWGGPVLLARWDGDTLVEPEVVEAPAGNSYRLELDNLVIGDHPGVTFGMHLCRGNQASRWLVSGGYDWIAARL